MIVEYANDIVQLCKVFEKAAAAGADEIKGELVNGVYRIEYEEAKECQTAHSEEM